MTLNQWANALINLECAGHKQFIEGRIDKLEDSISRFKKGQISLDSFLKIFPDFLKAGNYNGTAILLIKDEQPFLITSKQLIVDQIASSSAHAPSPFPAIFIVPSLNQCFNGCEVAPVSLEFDPGSNNLLVHSYLDLAMLKLNDRQVEELKKAKGKDFMAVTMADLTAEEPQTGQPVSALGFPAKSQLVVQNELFHKEFSWASAYYSTPVASFGKVSMNYEQLPFFWADMNLYHGFGGSPVLFNDQLVGVVSAQTLHTAESTTTANTPQHFNALIKSKYILEMLNTPSGV